MGLYIKNVNFAYSPIFGIKNVSADFGNHITAIIGPNGSGKSTLLKCITNQLKWTGEIHHDGEFSHLKDKEFISKKLSYLPQTPDIFSSMSVFEAVLLGLISELGLRVTQEQERRAEEVLKLLDLEELARQNINELSGGQLQMVLLAQAIIKKPDILILDEPLNNLDIYRQFSFLNQISNLVEKHKMTSIIVMHDINMAAAYAESILIMRNGMVYSQGAPEDVITRKMMCEVYSIECEVHRGKNGKVVVEFIGIV